MSSLLSEIHFWTTQEDVITKNSYYGAFKYYSKKETPDLSSKKLYSEQRGILWNPVNKRQNKLKDKLKELEDNLIQNKIIDYLWKEDNLRLLLSTGLIVCIKINDRTGDILSISFDKQLSAKLQVNIICDGLILENQVICICNDGHVLGYGASWKDGWLLEGGPRRRIHSHGEWLVVWGKPGSEHPQPWSPLTKDYQRANLHLYWLGMKGPELLAYKSTDGEPFIIVASKIHLQTIISVEQKVTQRGNVSVEVISLELSSNTLKTVAITSVPLQTQVSCCELSSNEVYLLICCIDSTLALLDRNRGSTKTIKASFIPTLCTWQKSSALAAICNEKGQLQYYDVALNCVKTQITSEDDISSPLLDLTGYFHSQVSVVSLNWDNTHLIVALEQGPLMCITHLPKSLTFPSLAKSYVNRYEIKKAITLLLSWEFDEDAFFILQRIVSFLLKRPITPEIAQQLQDVLGCYHASALPLSAEVRNQYGNQVFSLTRRYFHQLVRAEMYETAFLLAVDMGHHDLFMDLHYVAVKIGETEMAAAARAQASALVSRCSSEASNCSNSSCSECSSPCGNETNEKLTKHETTNSGSGFSPLDNQNDNLLSTNFMSTNFNQPETHKTQTVAENNSSDFPKLIQPKLNFVKPPQISPTFKKPLKVPPLPFNFPSPSILNSNLGIPFIGYVGTQNNHGIYNSTNYSHSTNQRQVSTNSSVVDSIGNSQTHFGDSKKSYSNDHSLISFEPEKQILKTGSNMQATNFGEYVQTNFEESNLSLNFTGKNPSNNINEVASSALTGKKIQAINIGGSVQPTYVGKSNLSEKLFESQLNTAWMAQTKMNLLPKENRIISQHNLHRSSFVPEKPIITPPLPVTNNALSYPTHLPFQTVPTSRNFVPRTDTFSITSTLPPTTLHPSGMSPTVSMKKVQSKVKFSDTVTAFIVPEVKRPLRPPPPPHVTDPQKELADSLPLCHPNEDYLKDFAPVKQNENSIDNKNPPKIKVVHFGVV